MDDPFIILTPLLVLPIVALLAFVGCVLDTSPTGTMFWMDYVAGLDKDVATLDPRFDIVIGDWNGSFGAFDFYEEPPPNPAGGSIPVPVRASKGEKDPMPYGKGSVTGRCLLVLKSGALIELTTGPRFLDTKIGGLSFTLRRALKPSASEFYLTVP